MPKIFGRNPAFYAGLVEAVLAVIVTIPALHFSPALSAAILAVVVSGLGVYTAFMTHQSMLAVGSGLLKALFVLVAFTRFDVSEATQGALIGLFAVVVAAFQHSQSIPVEGDQEPYFDKAA